MLKIYRNTHPSSQNGGQEFLFGVLGCITIDGMILGRELGWVMVTDGVDNSSDYVDADKRGGIIDILLKYLLSKISMGGIVPLLCMSPILVQHKYGNRFQLDCKFVCKRNLEFFYSMIGKTCNN